MLNELLSNISLLALLAVVFSLSKFSRFSKDNSTKSKILVGVIFGVAASVVMFNPIIIPQGATFDTRGGAAMLVAVYGGPLSTIIAAIIGAVARLGVGGGSAIGGAASFLFYGLAGYIANRVLLSLERRPDWRFFTVLSFFGTACVLPAFFIGQNVEIGLAILKSAWWMLLGGNFFGTLILGQMVELDTRRHEFSEEIKKQKILVDSIIDAQPAHLVVIDSLCRIQHVNQAWLDFYADNSVHGTSKQDKSWINENYFMHWDTSKIDSELTPIKDNIENVVAGDLEEYNFLYSFHGNEAQRWFILMARPIHWHKGRGACLFHIDITQEQLTQQKAQLLLQAVDQSAVLTFITDVNGVIEYVNPKFTELTGYSAEEAIGQKPSLIKSDDTPPELYKDLWQTITAGQEWRGEIRDRCKTGEEFWSSVIISPVRGINGEIEHYISIHENITERKQLEEANYLANHDQLTGLDNRRSFRDAANLKMLEIKRENAQAAIVSLDVDFFKSVNDTHGHHVGDEVLCELALRLKQVAREQDIVARMGGEEFAILVSHKNSKEAVAAAERFRNAIESSPFQTSVGPLKITASFGVSSLSAELSLDDTLKACDKALYDAKEGGRNCVKYS
ncbi:MAG: diguanylate cyclase [Desulfobacterales bacterium]|nr:diguanylate cyclase [Desulfobacterales bacterium]